VVLAPEGVELHWADDSKSLRSSLQLRSEVRAMQCGYRICELAMAVADTVSAGSLLPELLLLLRHRGWHVKVYWKSCWGDVMRWLC
jgi:hypothetical protein